MSYMMLIFLWPNLVFIRFVFILKGLWYGEPQVSSDEEVA